MSDVILSTMFSYKIRDKYVVMGATLKCPHGERESILLPDVSTMTHITYNGLPQIPETATKAEINVMNFGECKKCGEPCKAKMKLAEKWLNAVPSFTSSGVKVLIETSDLHCRSNAGVIEITDCGQNSNIEELLARIGDPELTLQVRVQVLTYNLYANKDALMEELELESDSDFETYLERKLEMIRLFAEYEEASANRYLTRDNFYDHSKDPLYDFLFLNDDQLVAKYSLADRKNIMQGLKAGHDDKLEEKYGSSLSLRLTYKAIYTFGGWDSMISSIYAQDTANASMRYQQLSLLLMYPSMYKPGGILDGSGPVSDDVFDHSGTWDTSKGTGGFNIPTVNNFLNENVPKDFQNSVKNAFGSDAKVTTLTEDVTVYRYYGDGSNPKSFWVTPNEYSDPSSSLALPSVNSVEHMATYTIPKGTTILEGSVAPAFGQAGGGYQFYIPDPSVLN